MASYRIAAPDEYLAITGMGVKNVKITKAAWVWPFQRCMRFSVQPHDYAMNLQAMTKEKLQFLLPVVFTVGPDINDRGANKSKIGKQPAPVVSGAGSNGSAIDADDEEDYHHVQGREDRGDSLMKYAMLLADSGRDKKDTDRAFLENIVKGIIEGETRVLVSSMTMEEIFTEREVFKRRIFRNIKSELDQFGLKIYNANVKELKDAPNSIYFESLSRKAHEGATNQARIDVAEAQLRGNVGEAKRKGEQEREISKIHAETAVAKTERDIERASAEAVLDTRKAELSRDVEISRVAAQRSIEKQDEELKREVQQKRALAETERLRATEVVKATIERESKQQAADAHAYEIEAEAKANFEKDKQKAEAGAYKVKADTDAAAYRTRQNAEAWSHATVNQAQARLESETKNAQGMMAMAEAYAKMSEAFGGPAGLLQYMMIEKGTYVELAKANAEAIRGLQPKISIWNTGAEAGADGAGAASGSAGGVATMRNIYQMLPPLMTTINEQTGITLPEWQFGHLAKQTEEVSAAQKNANGA
ncbi:Flotillin-like protein 1 [Podospora fimiseda]|uniref:Flotillin-like protein 1 n=1 Tax=Podospora fimiseda TaxID=252190 RepID=A0AAN6YT37_9PEZI|nr:Flotillin-like protein 1 [Podospora fimiseda]